MRNIEFLVSKSPKSPFQISAELNGAAAITNENGTHVPYHTLMKEAAEVIDDLRFWLRITSEENYE